MVQMKRHQPRNYLHYQYRGGVDYICESFSYYVKQHQFQIHQILWLILYTAYECAWGIIFGYFSSSGPWNYMNIHGPAWIKAVLALYIHGDYNFRNMAWFPLLSGSKTKNTNDDAQNWLPMSSLTNDET